MPVVGAVDKVAELAEVDAEALDKNAYKIDIAKTLVKRTVLALAE